MSTKRVHELIVDTVEAAFKQAKHKIERRKIHLLKPHATMLDLAGIEGIPRKDSYMAALRYFEENHPTVNAHLSKENTATLHKKVAAYIKVEIHEHDLLAKKLRRSPEAVREHLVELEDHAKTLPRLMYPDPDSRPLDEAIRQHEKLSNVHTRQFIKETKDRIEEYSALLEKLQTRTRPM